MDVYIRCNIYILYIHIHIHIYIYIYILLFLQIFHYVKFCCNLFGKSLHRAFTVSIVLQIESCGGMRALVSSLKLYVYKIKTKANGDLE